MNFHVVKRQNLKKLSLLGVVALSGASWHPLYAQESLAGLGAASAAGAGLGAAAAGGISTGRFRNTPTTPAELGGEPGQDPAFPQGAGMGPGGAAMGGAPTAPVNTAPVAQTFGANSRAIVGQLMAPVRGTRMPQPTRVRRSPAAQAAYSRRVSKLSPQARKRAVLQKYKIPPVDWRRAYLPQDRYKFARAWKFVSTEDSTFYFAPEALARRRFNPNRVIGFRTWQDAMAAGYRPDPATRPMPGAQIAALASMTRGEGLYQYVDYVYSGQVSPQSLSATYSYAQQVKNALSRSKDGRKYLSGTIDKVLLAAVTGDSSSIPTVIVVDDGIVRPAPKVAAGNPGIGSDLGAIQGGAMGAPPVTPMGGPMGGKPQMSIGTPTGKADMAP